MKAVKFMVTKDFSDNTMVFVIDQTGRIVRRYYNPTHKSLSRISSFTYDNDYYTGTVLTKHSVSIFIKRK